MKWICKVCGYEHEGDTPPDACPLCGAGPDEFERVESSPAAPSPQTTVASSNDLMQCVLCDRELVQGQASCPSCGSRLASLASAPPKIASRPSAKRYVVAGAGVAGWTAAESIRERDPSGSITLLTREPCAPYYRLSLTRYLAGEIDAPRLIAHSPAWWAQHNIDLVLETDLLEVDRSKRELRTSRGTIAYDRLVAATGARSFLPPLSNAMVHGVTPLRSLVDARFVLRHASADTHVVVVGGGVLGLETAYGLSRKGCQVTVCEGAKQLLPRQLDAPSAAIFQKHLESKGIGFVLGDMPSEVVGDEIARGLKLASGAQLEAEVIIVSAGVRPNSLVWRNSGLRVDRGLFVDDAMQTSDSQIFAAGDLVEHKSVLYGIWPAAMEMGRVAGCNAAGGSESFPGLPMSHSLKVVDLDVFSIGSSRPESATMSEITRPVDPPNYAKLVVDRGIVVGAVLMGDTTLSAKLKTWVTERRDVSSILAANNSPEAIFSQLERG